MSTEASPQCKICHGAGSLQERKDNGMLHYKICQCVLVSRRMRAAAIRIARHVGPRASAYTFARYDAGAKAKNEQALTVARNFCDSWPRARAEGWMLGFWGPPGCGKTHLATAIATEVIWRFDASGAVVSVPDLLRAERASFRSASDDASAINRAMGFDILVLDDIGAEYMRTRTDARSDVDWVDEQLYLLLDARLRENRPTIYTTNFAPADLKRTLSERVYSRIEREQVMPALEMTRVERRARRDPGIIAELTAERTGENR